MTKSVARRASLRGSGPIVGLSDTLTQFEVDPFCAVSPACFLSARKTTPKGGNVSICQSKPAPHGSTFRFADLLTSNTKKEDQLDARFSRLDSLLRRLAFD